MLVALLSSLLTVSTTVRNQDQKHATNSASESSGLDALMALPSTEDPIELKLEGTNTLGHNLSIQLGALFLFTAEGRFPNSVLGTGERNTVLGPQTVWLTDDLLSPSKHFVYPSWVITTALDWFAGDRFKLRLFLTSGEIRGGGTLSPESDSALVFFGLPPSEFIESGVWLAEASLSWDAHPVSIELGRRFMDVAEGLVFADVGTGLFFAIDDFDRGLSFQAEFVAPGRDFDALQTPSPLLKASISLEWDWVNRIELFAASFFDRTDTLSDIFAATLSESVLNAQTDLTSNREERLQQSLLDALLLDDIGGSARLHYLGVTAGGQLGRARIKSRFAYNFGRFTLENELDPLLNSISGARIALRGFAFDLDVFLNIHGHWGPGLELIAFSGHDPQALADRRYGSFFAVAPLWTYSTIFFASGVNQTFTAARGSAAGINGHGVFGGGPTLEWTSRTWALEAKALALFAHEPIGPQIGRGGRFYGVEPNMTLQYPLSAALGVRVIAGVLWPGSFFPQDSMAYRSLIVLDGKVEW